ncbi:MAG: ACP S-malonyltransferase [Oscillospiraceae bacterium]|nr:ACP S-malonyltransferase [Oscillospiraceae bacterium]
MKLAFLYAGQGTQHVGMGADLYAAYPAFRTVFDNATTAFDLKALCFDGPEEQLCDTRYTQPCMVAFAAGVTAVLNTKGIRPSMAAGLSLGEYSALYAAGVFDFATVMELITYRANAMAEAVTDRPCGMSAVLKLGRAPLQEVCKKAGERGVVEIANFNCPGQIVIAGDAAAVDYACTLAKEAGAGRCIPLHVSGPFHTSLMQPARDALHAYFPKVLFQAMQFPVLFNCTGNTLQTGEEIHTLLEQQVCSSVYMEDTIRRMEEAGVDTILEIGPGKALSGFVKKTAPSIRCFAVETAEQLEAAAAAIKGENVL